MGIINTFMSEQIIMKTGWVLVHFLWQGCIIIALIWYLMKILARASANSRYVAACLGLLLMLLSPAGTFLAMNSSDDMNTSASVILQYHTISEPQATEDLHQKVITSDNNLTSPVKPTENNFNITIESVLPYCVMGWAIGVTGLSIWYLGGWCQLQKLRRLGTVTVSNRIKEKSLELARQLGIRRAILIVESVLVQTPTVIGWLKPIILLPASALTGLSEVQLKALITHELAHIKRHDYLVNIIQTVIEILGFYHPAVWWISRRIRIERENCCDDMAAALIQDRKEYAKALLSMEELRALQLYFAVAAGPGHLENRIERLLRQKSNRHEKPGWIPIAVTCGLMMVLIFSIAVTAQTPDKSPERILHFPTEYSLGRILIQDETLQRHIQDFEHWIDNAPWEPLGPAIGDVRIPAGKRVQLTINSVVWESLENLAPLKNLKPDDIHTLILSPYWLGGKAPSEKCIPYIQHLTGLKVLDMSGMVVSQQGLKLLSNMKQLERIGVPDNLTNGGLATIVKMQSLKAVYMGMKPQLSVKGISLFTQLPNLEELSLPGDNLTDEGLSHLSGLTSLNYLYIAGGRFSQKGFASIAAIPNLRIARIYTDNCGDSGAMELAKHPRLENLSLCWLRDITDQGVYYLSQMPSLKKLNISSASLTDKSLEYLGQNKNIEYLTLPSVRYVNENQPPVDAFSDKGVIHLSNMKNLKYLHVSASSRSPLTDLSLFAISKLANLETLWIGGTGFTNAGIKELSRMKNLKELLISAAPAVTDEGAACLSSLDNLESLNWTRNTKVTFAGLNRLSGLKKLKRLECIEIQRGTATLSLVGLDSLEDLRITLPMKFDKNNPMPKYTESFTDADMVCLSDLKKLNWLSLCGNGINDTGLEYLSDLDNLATLFLYGQSQITDNGLKYLSGLNRLRQLHIKDGHFTNKALETLAKLNSLENLELTSDTAFSNAAVKEFKAHAKNIQQLILDVNTNGQQSARNGAYGGIAVGPAIRH